MSVQIPVFDLKIAMNKSFVIPAVFVTVFLSFLVSKAEEFDVFHGVKYVSVSESKLFSGTITLSRIGGEYKDFAAKGDVLALIPGDILSCRFKLPDNASNVKATIDYYVSNDSAIGKIRLNKELFSEDNSLLKKRTQQGMMTAEVLLENAQIQNELKVFSIEGEVCIHQIKINYDYRMPSCKTDDVTVVLTSPVANTDVLQQNMRFEWKIKGARKNGWVTLKYQKQDNGAWKTVPGAELLDCQATKKSGDYCEFFWNNHGLSAIPKFQIEYHDYNAELPKRFSREMRPFVLDNTKSVDAFILLVKRFLEEDKELLKTVVLKRDKITVFTPTKRTWEEYGYQQAINSGIGQERTIVDLLASGTILASAIKLATLAEERQDKDFEVKFALLYPATVKKELYYFDILEKSLNNLEQSVHKRIFLEKSQEHKQLASIMNDITKFQSKVKNDKKKYLSYSVVSPYLAVVERALYWKEQKEFTIGKTGFNLLIDAIFELYYYPEHGAYPYISIDDLEMIVWIMNEIGWIQECNDDVKNQFTKLQNEYPFYENYIKKNVEMAHAEKVAKNLQELLDIKLQILLGTFERVKKEENLTNQE